MGENGSVKDRTHWQYKKKKIQSTEKMDIKIRCKTEKRQRKG